MVNSSILLRIRSDFSTVMYVMRSYQPLTLDEEVAACTTAKEARRKATAHVQERPGLLQHFMRDDEEFQTDFFAALEAHPRRPRTTLLKAGKAYRERLDTSFMPGMGLSGYGLVHLDRLTHHNGFSTLVDEYCAARERVVNGELALLIGLSKRVAKKNFSKLTNGGIYYAINHIFSDIYIPVLKLFDTFDPDIVKASTQEYKPRFYNYILPRMRSVARRSAKRLRFGSTCEQEFQHYSLARPTNEEGDEFEETIGEDPDVERRLVLDDATEQIGQRLAREESGLLGLRFIAGYTLQEIGDWHGLTRERIRQLEARAIRKARGQAAREGLTFTELMEVAERKSYTV